MKLPLLLAATAASLLTAGARAQALSPQALYQMLAPSVWLVTSYDADGIALGTGSAVVTGPETLLTNCHVLQKARRIGIRNDNVSHEARLQHIDVERDMCQITARNLRAPAVALGDSDKLAVGQKVYALGNPRRLELTLSDGLVSALRLDEDHRLLQMIQTTAPISPGSSGGGLFDDQGRLIGITTAVLKDSQNLNFAIPINWVRELPARSDAALRAAKAAPAATAAPAPAAPPQAVAGLGTPESAPVNDACRREYRLYIESSNPKAFAITSDGRCWWQRTRTPSRPQIASHPDPAVRALELCNHFFGSSANCALYAVDNNIIFKR